jgi:hypothetical protein
MPMKLKFDDKGAVVVVDGNPVYIHDDGKEIPFNADGAVAKITQLNGEAMGHRQAKEDAEKIAAAFKGIDPIAAKTALDTMKNIDQKTLVAAGEVETIKQEAIRAMEERLKGVEAKIPPIEQDRDKYKDAFHGEKISNAFANSKFVSEKLIIPPDLVQSSFGKHFKYENDTIIGYDANGSKLFSRTKPGEIATFEEGIEIVVESYPGRERILKGTGASGGGGGGGNMINGKRTVNRAAFDKMTPVEQASTALAAKKGEVALVD